VPEFAPPPVFFGQILNPGKFDIALFTYINTLDAGDNVEIWRCHGIQNLSGYCNSVVSKALLASNTTLDPVARAALLNRADAQLAADLPGISLFERPAFRGLQDQAARHRRQRHDRRLALECGGLVPVALSRRHGFVTKP
jgi:ABC-type transport system substrate-binding protein